MEVLIAVLAVLAGVIGILGSVLPALPGPPLTWVGMLLLYLWGGTDGAGEHMSLTLLLVMLGVTVAVSIIDYVVPLYFTKLTGGTKAAERGAMAGLIFGLFVVEKVCRSGSEIRFRVISRFPCRHRSETHCVWGNDVLYYCLHIKR